MASISAGEQTKRFFVDRAGLTLKAWFRFFDKNDDGLITFDEFCRGMQEMGFPGDIIKLWREMDADGSGGLTLDEIDQENADLWSSFRRWCGATFEGGLDLIQQVSKKAQESTSSQRKSVLDGSESLSFSRTFSKGQESLKRDEFKANISKMGWKGLFEDVLWNSLDKEDKGFLVKGNLIWLDKECKKQRRRNEIRDNNVLVQAKKAKDKCAAISALKDFRRFLKKTFGNFFRAWRKGLDLDGTMSVTRHELFRACTSMQWQGDARALWRAVDQDGSGQTSLEELDKKSTKVLASFKVWAIKKYGSCAQAFVALDRFRNRRLKLDDFKESCNQLGYSGQVKMLFVMLDCDDKRHLLEQDFAILDMWHPPEYLTARPSPDAAAEFRQCLMRRYASYLAAWRDILDRDDSNRVSWQEFRDGCKKLNFKGDIPGAWLHLDEDMSGFISLNEIDNVAAEAINSFKQWADDEMGGVRCAFRILDQDNSNELSLREFRRSARDYGFEGDATNIFEILDINRVGRISYGQLAFIDDWHMNYDDAEEDDDGIDEGAYAPQARAGRPALITYRTDCPGPGAYNLTSSFGSSEKAPMIKHNGGFSFSRTITRSKKHKVASSKYDVGPAPGQYNPEPAKVEKSRKPAWGFGTMRRNLRPVRPNSSKSPGPGSYETVTSKPTRGPAFSMGSRPPIVVHPNQKLFKI